MKKMQVMLVPWLILALIGVVVGCGTDDSMTPTTILTPTTTSTPTPALTPMPTPTSMLEANYTTHTDALNGFSIGYPEEWQMKAAANALFAVQALERCEGQDVTFHLQKMELLVKTDVETFFGPILSDTFSSQERYFIYGEKVGVSDRSAIKWVTSFENVYGIPLKEMSFYVLDTKAAWTLSYAVASACWRQYEDIFQHMVDSFKLS